MLCPRRLLLGSLCLLAGLLSLAGQQIFRLPYRHFTVHDGLAQQQAVSLHQDSRGYIWIGTKAGISKFNGERFENFRPAQGAPGEHASRLETDSKGNIWAFTSTGAGYYDGARWHTVSREHQANLFFARKDSDSLFFDVEKHTLWRLDGDTVLRLGSPGQLPPERQWLQDTSATWLSYADSDKAWTFIKLSNQGSIADVLRIDATTHFVTTQFSDGQKFRFSFPNRGGLMHISRLGETKPFDSISCEIIRDRGPIRTALFCRNGDLYLIGRNNRVYYKPSGKIQAIRLDIPIHNPSCLLEDREGAVWIGAEDGLYQYFPRGFRYLPANAVPTPWSIVEDHAGAIWVGSFGHGLWRLHADRLERMSSPAGAPNPNVFYMGAAKDKQGNLYFSHEYNLWKYRNGRYQPVFDDQDFFTDNFTVLYCYFDGVANKILAGIQGGVLIADVRTGATTRLQIEAEPSDYVRGIARDQRDQYWFADGAEGIICYHIPTGRRTTYSKNRAGISLKKGSCLETDPIGGIWMGNAKGLFYFSEKTGDFNVVGREVVTNAVFNLKIVDSFLLIGSLAGLHVLNLPVFYATGDAQIKTYNQHNGFLGIEPGQNGVLLDSKGNYWALCSNQIATIPKHALSLSDYPSRVRIFQINDQRVPYSGARPIRLPKGENQITVRFESIGFQRPLRTQYSWQLLGPGCDTLWTEWTEDQIAFFPQLPSGDYTFAVRSRHPSSTANFEQDRYRFRVQLPFYREPFFYQYVLIAGLLLALLFGAGLWLYRKARRETQKARTAAAEREQMMKYYQIQTLQAQLQPHFVFNLLNAIKSFIVRGRPDEAEEQIERLSKVMRRFLESSISSDLEQLTQRQQEITLKSEIELLHYYIELMQVLKPGKFTYSIDLEPGLQPANMVVAPMIIQPFVENAIKHGLVPKKDGKGHLAIRFFTCPGGLCCTVQDNGPGLTPPQPPAFPESQRKKPMGIDLVLNRVKLLRNFGIQIDIDLETPPQGGTLVRIRFAE